MGAYATKLELAIRNCSLKVFKDLGIWTLKDVRRLHHRYKRLGGNFGIVQSQFETLLSFKKPPVCNIGELFDSLDISRNGRVDGLEFLGALAVICSGDDDGTSRFLFELCDFNLNGTLCKAEMILMFRCTVFGLLKLLECPITESESLNNDSFIKLQEEAFERCDRDNDQKIGYSEFLSWTHSNRDIMKQFRMFNSKVELAAKETIRRETAAFLPENEAKLGRENFENAFFYLDNPPPLYANLPKKIDEEPRAENDGTLLIYDKKREVDCNLSFSSTPKIHSWRSSIVEPQNYISKWNEADIPGCNIELEWVHGYGSFGTRNNIFIDIDGKVVYPAAKLGIVLDRKSHRQHYYSNHYFEIISIAIHPEGDLIATGDMVPRHIPDKPTIHIWDTADCTNTTILTGFHKHGIALLAFSSINSDGKLLASCGLDTHHSIAVYNWNTGLIVSR